MSTTGYVYACLSTLTIGFLSSALVLPAIAQVTSDGTTNTIVNQSGNNFTILNGIEKANNLFHSFSNFSVPAGGSANFDLSNTPNITTIFSRVTGGNVSNIDGLIQTLNSNNPVSWFLINPAGIVFGKNASLNIGGSFVGTTANSIKFADGTEFSAVNPTETPLLTMSVPIGLQMGQNPGAISVQNTGHRLTRGLVTPIVQSSNPVGLAVQPGNTLALIGGEINLVGGVIVAPSGHIELGSSKTGIVNIDTTSNQWKFDYSNISQFANIQLSQQALVNASGSPAGSLRLQGQNISVLEGSVALLENFGSAGLGNLVVNASGTLAMRQTGVYGFANSQLITDNLGSGNGNNIAISAQQLQIQDGSEITARTFGAGIGGDISVNVSGLTTLDGWSAVDPSLVSLIGVKTLGSGRGGDITVSTNQLRATNGGVITNTPLGKAAAGDVTVHANDWIELIGENPLARIPSAISSIAVSQGNGGNLNITTSRLTLRDGGVVNATTIAAGNSGRISITALDRVEVSGVNSITGRQSRLASAANTPNGRIFNITFPLTGNAGGVFLNTPLLYVSDRGIVGVENQGRGDAGQLVINADRVMLDRQGIVTAATASGKGGDITLNLGELLLLRHQSIITTTAGGSGKGGNITINAPIIVGFENSDIVANAVNGQGGNIQITTQGIFGLKYRPQLTRENDITASSQFGVNGNVQITSPNVDPNSGLVQLPENVTDPSQQIATGCSNNTGSSFVVTGRGGIPQNPTQQVRSDVYDGLRLRTWSDIRDISAYRKTQKVQAQIPESPEILVQATSWHRNAQGKIELVADKSPTYLQQPLTCAAVTKI
ncbi:two-partner secretion domain-containing protein [Nostoc sp.]|uniref:two-partner secretion domain-containing protein n=1 Tax=Nostoc sp. TaxID=1180 RepID=UPI00303D6AFD